MTSEDMQFPAYRKYKNGKNYFKILSPVEFEELQVIGKTAVRRRTVARQFPEKQFIKDLLYDFESMAEKISAQTFDDIQKLVKT